MSRFNLKTGDILLFDDGQGGSTFATLFTGLIKYFTKSKFSHVAMVIKDPTFIHPSLKGYYVWESSWEGKPDPQDGVVKLGVQITPFEEIYQHYSSTGGSIYARRVECDPALFNDEKLSEIHEVVYGKPYDMVPKDWVEGIFRKDSDPDRTDRFWCSALVGYIYAKAGVINEKTDWSDLRPSDFSIEGRDILQFNKGCSLEQNEEHIL